MKLEDFITEYILDPIALQLPQATNVNIGLLYHPVQTSVSAHWSNENSDVVGLYKMDLTPELKHQLDEFYSWYLLGSDDPMWYLMPIIGSKNYDRTPILDTGKIMIEEHYMKPLLTKLRTDFGPTPEITITIHQPDTVSNEIILYSFVDWPDDPRYPYDKDHRRELVYQCGTWYSNSAATCHTHKYPVSPEIQHWMTQRVMWNRLSTTKDTMWFTFRLTDAGQTHEYDHN